MGVQELIATAELKRLAAKLPKCKTGAETNCQYNQKVILLVVKMHHLRPCGGRQMKEACSKRIIFFKADSKNFFPDRQHVNFMKHLHKHPLCRINRD